MLRTISRLGRRDKGLVIHPQDGKIKFIAAIGNSSEEGSGFERLINVIEVAKFLNVSEQEIYKLARIGDLPHVRIGSRILFRPEDIDQFIKDNLIEKKEDRDEENWN